MMVLYYVPMVKQTETTQAATKPVQDPVWKLWRTPAQHMIDTVLAKPAWAGGGTQKPTRKICRTCYDDPCRCRQIQADLVAAARPATPPTLAHRSTDPCRRCGTYCYGDCGAA